MGATDLLTDVVTFPIGVISTEATVLHLQLRHMVDCGDWPKRVKTLCVSLAAPVLALFWRALHDPEAEQLAKAPPGPRPAGLSRGGAESLLSHARPGAPRRARAPSPAPMRGRSRATVYSACV